MRLGNHGAFVAKLRTLHWMPQAQHTTRMPQAKPPEAEDGLPRGSEVLVPSAAVAAARAGKVRDFIVFLSDGYRTADGERRLKLPGGERQRVWIARDC